MSTSLGAHSMILKVARQASPHEDLRRQRTFAWAVAALLICGSPLLSKWLTVMSGSAKAKSKLRRLHRWLNNERVDVGAYYRPFIQKALSAWSGKQVILAIDGTSVRDVCVVCRVSLIYRGRAIPLVWKTLESRSHSIAYSRYIDLLEQVCALLPADCEITLLGDRGFGHRKLMKWCERSGWQFILRLKSDSWVILAGGRKRQLRTWRPERQSLRCLADARLLESGNKPTSPFTVCIIRAPEPAEEYWYLVTNRPTGGYDVIADYALRAGIEASFRDDKSGGWNWEDSQLTDPCEVDRLCLVMAVATLYSVTEGTMIADSGRREELDPHDSRGLSYFQIGLRSFQRNLAQGLRLRLRLHLDPRPDPQPVSPYGIPFLLSRRIRWLPATIPAGC